MTSVRTYGAVWPPCPQNGTALVLCNDKLFLREVLVNMTVIKDNALNYDYPKSIFLSEKSNHLFYLVILIQVRRNGAEFIF